MTVRVVTDSVSDLPPQVVEELGITVVPLNVRFGEQTYRDGVDLTAQNNIPRVEFHAAFDTLEYLRRGGRIGKAQALLGSVLKVHPIITLKDGVVEPAGRARSRAAVIDHLYDFAASYSRIEEMAVEDAACSDDAEQLVERLGSIFPKQRIYRSRTTPVIGTHTGPGLLLLAVMGDK